MTEYSKYDEARESFDWNLPEKYNPAFDCVQKHSSKPEDRTALIDAATERHYTFSEIDNAASQLANALLELGIEVGDRVGVVAPQRPETPISHTALWMIGAVTIPLTTLFGQDALAFRLDDSEAKAVIYDPIVRDDLAKASAQCNQLEAVIELGPTPWYLSKTSKDDSTKNESSKSFHCEQYDYENLVAGRETSIQTYASTPETDSVIMYTSGSTGPPKGVRHSHALWLGRAAAAYNFFNCGLDNENAVSWTPADWAWGSALGGLLMGSWHHGTPVVAAPMQGFDSTSVFTLCEDHKISHALIPPTALRMLMAENPKEYDLNLSAVATAGEPLTPEILDWSDESFEDLAINEYYGQTELNLVVANVSRWFEVQPGSMGKALPGYDVTILDRETYEELPHGEIGEIAVRPHDECVFFDEYLNRPEATVSKQVGDWYLTNDLGSRDHDGYFWFESRADDIIITSGYRVGPLEVEEVLLDHPAVKQAGVIGIPDEMRGEIIKAYIEPTPETDPDDELRGNLRQRARDRLAEYEYPRQIEFVDSLPMTTSGKIQRVKLRERYSN